MPNIGLEAGMSPLAIFQLPTLGVQKFISAHLVPLNALADASNVMMYKGRLQPRPGMLDVGDSGVVPNKLYGTIGSNNILGGATFIDNAGLYHVTAISKTGCYDCTNPPASFTLTSSGTYAAGDDSVIEMVVYYPGLIGYGAVGLVAEKTKALLGWSVGTGLAVIPPTTGTVPVNVQSVVIVGGRIVCLIAAGGGGGYTQDTLVWSGVNNPQNWPALAYAPVNATQDLGVCLRRLGSTGFAVYKKRSIYIIRSQPGTDASAFSVSEPFHAEGPAGIHAIVDVDGRHIYLTENGRIGVFDGTRYPVWIADHVWQYLQDDIDKNYEYKILGVYSYRDRSIFFFYPRVADADGKLRGIVMINLLPQLTGNPDTIYNAPIFLGVTAKPITFGLTLYLDAEQPNTLLFDTTNHIIYFNEETATDLGSSFDGYFQTPLFMLPSLQNQQVNVELFTQRASNLGTLKLSLMLSNMLDTALGTQSAQQTVTLTSAPVLEYFGFNLQSRFAGIRVDFNSATGRPYYVGAALYGRSTIPLRGA